MNLFSNWSIRVSLSGDEEGVRVVFGLTDGRVVHGRVSKSSAISTTTTTTKTTTKRARERVFEFLFLGFFPSPNKPFTTNAFLNPVFSFYHHRPFRAFEKSFVVFAPSLVYPWFSTA